MIDVLRELGVSCIVVCALVYLRNETFWIARELCDPVLGLSIGITRFFVGVSEFRHYDR